MKPVHAVLLILAGALSGAMILKIGQQRKQAPPVTVAQAGAAVATVPALPAPVAVLSEPAAPPPEIAAPVEKKTSPAPVAKQVKKLEPTVREKPPAKRSEPVRTAQVMLPAQVRPVIPAPPQPAPEPAPQPMSPPARPEPVKPAPVVAPQPPPNQATLNAGVLIPVRLIDGLSSGRNHAGDVFTGTLDKELMADGFVIAERGARVEGRVAACDPGGKLHGAATMTVELTRVRLSDGQAIGIATDGFVKRAEPGTRQDVAKIGGGAAIGAVIGAIAGGGKGAAIGAGVGGGAGTGAVLLTQRPATLPSETRMSFRLREAVTVTERR